MNITLKYLNIRLVFVYCETQIIEFKVGILVIKLPITEKKQKLCY